MRAARRRRRSRSPSARRRAARSRAMRSGSRTSPGRGGPRDASRPRARRRARSSAASAIETGRPERRSSATARVDRAPVVGGIGPDHTDRALARPRRPGEPRRHEAKPRRRLVAEVAQHRPQAGPAAGDDPALAGEHELGVEGGLAHQLRARYWRSRPRSVRSAGSRCRSGSERCGTRSRRARAARGGGSARRPDARRSAAQRSPSPVGLANERREPGVPGVAAMDEPGAREVDDPAAGRPQAPLPHVLVEAVRHPFVERARPARAHACRAPCSRPRRARSPGRRPRRPGS